MLIIFANTLFVKIREREKMKRKGLYRPTVEDAIEIGGIETLHPGGFACTSREDWRLWFQYSRWALLIWVCPLLFDLCLCEDMGCPLVPCAMDQAVLRFVRSPIFSQAIWGVLICQFCFRILLSPCYQIEQCPCSTWFRPSRRTRS